MSLRSRLRTVYVCKKQLQLTLHEAGHNTKKVKKFRHCGFVFVVVVVFYCFLFGWFLFCFFEGGEIFNWIHLFMCLANKTKLSTLQTEEFSNMHFLLRQHKCFRSQIFIHNVQILYFTVYLKWTWREWSWWNECKHHGHWSPETRHPLRAKNKFIN